MNDQQQHPDAREIGGVITRVNRLGTATEAMFSRLYKGLNRRSRLDTAQMQIRRLGEQNTDLQRRLKVSDLEVDRLQGILASIGEGVIMQDIEGRIVLVNKAARDLLGSQKAFWQSELGAMFNEHNSIVKMDTEVALLGDPTRVEINNKIIGAQLAAVADSAGNRLGTVIVLRDVTAEALSDRLKDQFITAISHELRTPMAVIKGMSEVILSQPTDAQPNRRLLETLSRNVDILDRMIVELLDLSELAGGDFQIRHESLHLEELVWNVVNGMQPEAQKGKLDITVMVRDADHLVVLGDDHRLRWALGHLLQNSIRYTESGGHIIITMRRTDDDSIAIQVVDTGVGITDKDLPHVFERFYRGEPRTPEGRLLDPRGLGQGLFIARTVAEVHNGYLSVSSQTGSGSIFTMVLPAAPSLN